MDKPMEIHIYRAIDRCKIGIWYYSAGVMVVNNISLMQKAQGTNHLFIESFLFPVFIFIHTFFSL